MTQKLTQSKMKNRTEAQILLAQFFTPEPIADYMASMFRASNKKTVAILDPGAGEGILGLALLRRLNKKNSKATFVEFDESTSVTLKSNVDSLAPHAVTNVINGDFITTALQLEREDQRFSHVILNPPYFKLRVDSPSSKLLRQHGIQITNIYAAFVWLSAKLLEDNGQLVAIIPRSFCNGPYFLSFREYITDNFSLDGIHIFASRNKAFSKDSVLQENIILHISKRKQVPEVKLTYSTDQSFTDIEEKLVPLELIIEPADNSKTIHIPSFGQSVSLNDHLSNNLHDLGLMVSTGPVVDFRLKTQILGTGLANSVPLLYPAHISGHETDWPLVAFKKTGQHYLPANTEKKVSTSKDAESAVADKNVLPLDGYYVIVRRFSSKEEKRRIFAAVVSPERFNDNSITFENHLNYFHINKHGLSKDLAYGLCAYLNSSVLDEHFRKVSGHTQVNVSDLKRMPYPSINQLNKLGKTMQSIDGLIDDIVTKEVFGKIK